ncbi:helix-turn-helix transcriptional regulator [Parabacteroides distasonis]|uniref:Helix-turn-helix transcriptional regulator n=1 Tax=Parabacteroides distasonis TaxID=823 RepID=A0A7L5EFG5_PARDI|nr:LuxR C-terminal-related transcriptional regulator [Parabacteroides distasonis]QJE30056.1 helix-turn-helix transcriptional regulator [Parabacteroides distasonis]WRY45191.1 LuxR C-terminal-related transcriptional regulator [Parabacteroides distasonis]
MDKKLQNEYLRLFDSMNLREDCLDYIIADRHIKMLKESPYLKTTAITLYDNCRRCHIYESDYHRYLFKDEDGTYRDMQIHPDDMDAVVKNAISVLRHIFSQQTHIANSKLIRQYRVRINGIYKRITEEMQIIETDPAGNPWLSLSIVNISPDQEEPFIVRSKLIDTKTGDTFTPLDDLYDRDTILTAREIEVLKKISQGLLSKEISDILGLSVHTVNTHRQRILAKLNVNNSIEAVKYATVLGIIK